MAILSCRRRPKLNIEMVKLGKLEAVRFPKKAYTRMKFHVLSIFRVSDMGLHCYIRPSVCLSVRLEILETNCTDN